MMCEGFVSFLLFLLLWILMKRNPFQFPTIVLMTISLDRWGLDQSLLLLGLILLLVGKRKLRRSGLLMASILLLWVFLLLMIGVLLEGLGVGLLERVIPSGRRGIGSGACWNCKNRCDWWFSLGFSWS